MYRLVVNPGSTQRWEMRLKAGANSIGRSAENDFQIEHDSISSLHCVIQVGPGRIVIRDRGSTNGTFLNDRLIHESDLHPGETLQVGAIRMVLEECEQDEAAIAIDNPAHATVGGAMLESRLHLEPVARASSNPSIGPSNSSPAMVEEEKPIQCKNHYQNIARYKCPKCVRYLCDLCVNTRGTAGGGQKFCKICSTESVPVIFKHTMEAVDFFAEARQAFFYPIRGDGLVLLFGGSFFFGFLDLANYVSRHAFQYGLRAMMMRVTIFTFIFGTGYLFAYLKKIIAASVAGDAYMPDWPEFSEWHADIVAPMFQFLVLAVLCFGPAAALQIWSEGDYPWLVWPLLFLGCTYFPMAFLGIAMFDSLTALNPKFVAGSILRVPKEYALCVIVFCGIIGIRWVLETVLGKLLGIPLAPALIADLIMIYLLMAEARILGILYYASKRELNWFRRAAAAPKHSRPGKEGV